MHVGSKTHAVICNTSGVVHTREASHTCMLPELISPNQQQVCTAGLRCCLGTTDVSQATNKAEGTAQAAKSDWLQEEQQAAARAAAKKANRQKQKAKGGQEQKQNARKQQAQLQQQLLSLRLNLRTDTVNYNCKQNKLGDILQQTWTMVSQTSEHARC